MASRRRSSPPLRFLYPRETLPESETYPGLLERLEAHGWELSADPDQQDRPEDDYRSEVWSVDVRQGDGHRTVRVPWDRWSAFARVAFEQVRFIETFEAIWHDDTKTAEAAVTPAVRMSHHNPHPIWSSPDAFCDPDKAVEDEEQFFPRQDQDGGLHLFFPPGQTIRVRRGGATIELSAPTTVFAAFYDVAMDTPNATLKVSVDDLSESPADLLRGLASDFLFELDMRTRWGIQLLTVAPEPEPPASSSSAIRMHFPSATYRPDAKSLYWYARSTSRFPLAQYVAYYQVLEHFFGPFSRLHAIEQAVSTLRDPTFDRSDVESVHNLLADAAPSFSSMAKEQTQLRSALVTCVTPQELRRFIRADPERKWALTTDRFDSVPKILTDESDEKLWESASEHVYKLRNRIVHKKQNDSSHDIGLLLPNSQDEALLGHDILLVRWLAQKAIVRDAS